MVHKLLVEPTASRNIDYVIEEKNLNGDKEPRMFIVGEYMCAEKENKNHRVYCNQEMSKEVLRYNKDFIENKRALGELNHPENAEVSLDRACHLVTELYMDRNTCMGKSLVLDTPCGKVLQSLIKDGVQCGVSSRALGKLIPMEGKEDINKVEDMRLIAIDCVADPSNPGSFVNGILESKQYVLSDAGKFEEIYDQFENALATLPTKDVEDYLKEQVMQFISKLQGKS
jgi:hypothetical protein|tara:strand:- start:10271 stop:10954 length:684 start_codon:yes stop_codon:yes gene_type:complete